jgi:hypothetical protein
MSEEYFKKYRQKVQESKQKKKEIRQIYNEATEKITELYNNVQSLEKECANMRRIITKMIEEGIDDVESRLTMNENYCTSLWSSNPNMDEDVIIYPHLYPEMLNQSVGNIINELNIIDGISPAIPSTTQKNPFGATGAQSMITQGGTYTIVTDWNNMMSAVPIQGMQGVAGVLPVTTFNNVKTTP